MAAYYNEIDPFAAQWLRNLIAAGHIVAGDVDERSIADVRAADLAGYDQCHFFAGIGAWSYALRQAGWPDNRPVWTGSCPCQPFSAAGKGEEFADARHLWPAWFRLICECRPVALFGEQVASRDALAWLDHVSTDLEGEGYAVGAVDSCAAGYGAPHIRQRLYFVADSNGGDASAEREQRSGEQRLLAASGEVEPLADDASEGLERTGGALLQGRNAGFIGDSQPRIVGHATSTRREAQHGFSFGVESRPAQFTHPGALSGMDHPVSTKEQPTATGRLYTLPSEASDMGNPASGGCRIGGDAPLAGNGGHADGASIVGKSEQSRLQGFAGDGDEGNQPGRLGARANGPTAEAGATNGFWADAEWIACRDGKARPTESGTFPLAHGTSQRVGRLRAYGNCICAPQATEFIRASMN